MLRSAPHWRNYSTDPDVSGTGTAPGRCGVSPLEGVAKNRQKRVTARGRLSPLAKITRTSKGLRYCSITATLYTVDMGHTRVGDHCPARPASPKLLIALHLREGCDCKDRASIHPVLPWWLAPEPTNPRCGHRNYRRRIASAKLDEAPDRRPRSDSR